MITKITKWRSVILGGGAGLLIGLGFLGGIMAERIRFEHQRTEVLNRYEGQWQASLMRLELTPVQLELTPAGEREASAAPWTIHLRRVDEALAQKNVSAAEQAWHDAYGAALGSRRWQGLIAVGDAYLQIGETAKGRKAAEARARKLYLAALFRARNEGSLDGVLRVAEAFAALGDREVVDQSLRIAERLATRSQDAQANARVQAFQEQLSARLLRPRTPAVTGALHAQDEPIPATRPAEHLTARETR